MDRTFLADNIVRNLWIFTRFILMIYLMHFHVFALSRCFILIINITSFIHPNGMQLSKPFSKGRFSFELDLRSKECLMRNMKLGAAFCLNFILLSPKQQDSILYIYFVFISVIMKYLLSLFYILQDYIIVKVYKVRP